MSRITLVLVAAGAALLATACSTSPKTTTPPKARPAVTAPALATSSPAAAAASTTPAAAGLSGKWSGQYSGAYSGTFTLNWTQAGSNLTGTIKLSSTGGRTSLHGKVNGSSITFGTVGSTAITYSGTVSGNSMSGNYQVQGASGSANGTWSAVKS